MTSPDSVGIVGGGILGLSVAREILRRRPGSELTLFEREDRLATHQTGHNSGVVHAGLYYAPGSLKAELCRRGVGLLRDFCAEHGLRYRELGKLVVASDEGQLPALADIEDRATRNGVPDLTRLDRTGMREIEPHVVGVAALHSPHTAVVDFVGVAEALAAEVTGGGGEVLTSQEVRAIRPHAGRVEVFTPSEVRPFDRVVACAGLRSDDIVTMIGATDDLRIVPFRGEYHDLSERAATHIRGLVYPVPDPRYPFLGVHLTRSVDDTVSAGPNAVLALAREGYRRTDVSLRHLGRLASWPGMRRLAVRHWRSGIREFASSISKRRYLAEVRRYLPDVELSDMTGRWAGVRAQAVARDGALVDDFAFVEQDDVLVVRNAPSPAATSSLAIAEHIADRLLT